MPEEKDEPSGFKVVDRRSFSVDGTPREEALRERPQDRETPQAPRRQPASPSAPREDDLLRESTDEEMSGFETLVSYLSTTAMFQLGLLPGPSGERIPADMLSARRTIDLMEVLEQKTRGNLTDSERRLLEDVLYELRMSFVEVEKRGARKGK